MSVKRFSNDKAVLIDVGTLQDFHHCHKENLDVQQQ